MERLIFGRVEIHSSSEKAKYHMTLTDDAGNNVIFDEISQQEAELLSRAVRNLNLLAQDCDITTILAFEREGVDVIPDLVEEKYNVGNEENGQ